MSPLEPQSAADYDDRSTQAVKSVLLEMGQILGSYKGKFVVVGGLIPWLLQNNEDMPHVGTLDIDLGLDPSALADGEYASLIESLQGRGYRQRADLKQFQLVRELPHDDGSASIEVVVDFLMQRDVKVVKNRPPLVEDFRAQGVNGTDLAIRLAQADRQYARGWHQYGHYFCLLNPCISGDEGVRARESAKAKGCLRHLLRHA